MKLVVDANVVISALISPYGKTSEILFSDQFELYSPEYLRRELEKYKKYICDKTGFSLEKIDFLISLIFLNIKIVPISEFQELLREASKICPDENDEEYFALVLKLNCPLWSNDKALKQSSLRVLNTSEVLDLI